MDLRGGVTLLQAGSRVLASRRVPPRDRVRPLLVSRVGLRRLRPRDGPAPGSDLRVRLPAPRALRPGAPPRARPRGSRQPAARRGPNPVEWSVMSGTGPYDFQLPDLRIVRSDLLVPHEREDESRTGRLSERLRRSGVLRNPPIVTEARSPDGGECFVVLDGANRVSVARDTDLPHFLVQVVRYDDSTVKLTTWHHALSGYPY